MLPSDFRTPIRARPSTYCAQCHWILNKEKSSQAFVYAVALHHNVPDSGHLIEEMLRQLLLGALLFAGCHAFTPSSLVWFTNDLRLHDHEALHILQSQKTPISPVYIFDREYLATQAPQSIQLSLSAVRNLKKAFQKLGGDLIVREGRAEEILPKLAKECEADSIWCYDDVSSSQRELISRGLLSLAGPEIKARKWAGRLRSSIKSSDVGTTYPEYMEAVRGVKVTAPLASLSGSVNIVAKDAGRLPTFEELLEAAHGHEGPQIKATRAAAARDEFLTPVYGPVEGGEELALRWLNEYMELGPDAFGQKHLPLSGDNGLEREAVRRVIQAQGLKGLFEGEVFSRSFSPLLGIGCLSPRTVAQALSDKEGQRAFFQPKDPEVAQVVEILEQKEWHTLLAEKDLSAAPVPEPMEFGYWKWHGYLVRYARTRRSRSVGDKPRPNLLLVHGFGASCDQWAKCFTQLGNDYDVWAIDLLGFGHSVKEPITYTQYLWQDQVRDFALEVIQAPYFIAGNSIGGYISMSVAADNNNLCKGLILINTAGKVVSNEVYEAELSARAGTTIEQATRTGGLGPFSGPPKLLLRAVSQGLFWYLQPRVAEICRNLYKKRPEQVDDRLVYNIVRDSKDPGALGVFASGGRLPPPRPANELLRKFNGPVLVAQGALDPLNDAKGRAELLRTCYDKTVVRLIEAGHCPHDEDPENVCKAIDEFIQSLQLDDAGLVQGTAPLPAAGAA